MIKFKCKLPLEPLNKAVALAQEVRKQWDKLEEERAATKKPDPVEDGRQALREYEHSMLVIDQAEQDTIQGGISLIDELKKEYSAALRAQVMPKGEEMMDSPDYLVIKEGLVTNSDQLRMIADRNQDNYTLLCVIDGYARANEWDGFAVIATDARLEAFGLNWLEMARRACAMPTGLSYVQLTAIDEMGRMAEEYGVAEELRAARGA